MRVRRRHRLRKILVWTFVLLAAILSGGLWFAYIYVTDSDTLAALIRANAPKYLPGSVVDVGRARVRLFGGEFHLTQVAIRQSIDGAPFLALKIPWLSIKHDSRAMLDGNFVPTDVVVAQPTLRLCRRKDGTWNLQGLLADPWPVTSMKTPPITIQNATVELCNLDANVVSEGESESVQGTTSAVLRDVTLHVESAGPGKLSFDGSARGDAFDRLSVRGNLDLHTGRLELKGDLARLAFGDPLRNKLPVEYRRLLDSVGVDGGEIDLRLDRLVVDPAAPADRWLSYDVSGHLRSVKLACRDRRLPFPINDLTAQFRLRDRMLEVERAEGFYGTTSIRIDTARFELGSDLTHAPFQLEMGVVDLELDDNLRDWVPAPFNAIWREFQPRGRVSLNAELARDTLDGPVRRKVGVDCDDVALIYQHFRYPLDHVRGRLDWEGDRVTVTGLNTLVGGRPLSATGTIDHPGPDAVVNLVFRGEAMPVDRTLLDALPPDVYQVVSEFRPSGTVRGVARVRRTPPEKPGDNPIGKVAIDAYLDLNERCGINWVKLPYPVNNLTGRLELHPDHWEFKNMRGMNGQAVITGSGSVIKRPGPGQQLDVDLSLRAEKLPFDDQLRTALPPAWQKSWQYLEPTGSSDVDAQIRVHHGEPDRYILVVQPRPATAVRLSYSRDPKPGDPGGPFELRLGDVTGRFVFNNGPVDMKDVGFTFHGAPVQFEGGRVVVENSGRFELGVNGLWVKEIRLDLPLRQIMPPVMSQFAQKLDDGRTFTLRGNLGLGWSGRPGESVKCRWNDTLVVFNDNSIQIQPGLALEHIQGQLDHVRGEADGETFRVHGALQLDSVSLLGQQITRLSSPLAVEAGVARLSDIRGDLLGGKLIGSLGVSLDATPHYEAKMAVQGANLQEYAKTLRGHQTFRGLVNGDIEVSGFGGDLRTLQGRGQAHISDGDLGTLPVYLRLLNVLQLSPATRTAFDSADAFWTIRDGKTSLEPVVLKGNPFSLHGGGTMDVQGELNLRLRVLYGRDRLHIRGFSDLIREASGQFLVVHVQGTPSFPQFRLLPLPEASDALKFLGQQRRTSDARLPSLPRRVARSGQP